MDNSTATIYKVGDVVSIREFLVTDSGLRVSRPWCSHGNGPYVVSEVDYVPANQVKMAGHPQWLTLTPVGTPSKRDDLEAPRGFEDIATPEAWSGMWLEKEDTQIEATFSKGDPWSGAVQVQMNPRFWTDADKMLADIDTTPKEDTIPKEGISRCKDCDTDCWDVPNKLKCWLYEEGTGHCPWIHLDVVFPP